MNVNTSNVFKKFFMNKLLEVRLLLMRENLEMTDFLIRIQNVKKVLVILPRDRAEEIFARKYLSQIREIFKGTRISTLDIFNLRKTDTNWIGIPTSSFMNKLRNEGFDFILDLNSSHDSLSTYFCASISAPMRLHLMSGRYDKIYNLYVRVQENASMEVRFKTLINYLEKFRHHKQVN